MAFDFGLKNLGIAIGQEISMTANTFYSLNTKDGIPSWKELDELIEKWNPAVLVLGNPLNMDGTDSEIKKKSDAFGKQLISRYERKLELSDERLSTKEALNRKKLFGKDSIYQNKFDVHSISAQIILENWFRNRK